MPQIGSLRQWLKVSLILAMLGAMFSTAPASGGTLRINPVPPDVTPQWVAMPDLPQMYYAPNLPTDVFRHLGRYYFNWEGIWYKSKSPKGPWMRLQQPPAILTRIPPSYFKLQPQAGGQPPAGAPPPEILYGPDGKPVTPPAPPAAPEPAMPAQPPEQFVSPAPAPPEPQPPQPPAPPAAPEGPSEPAPPAKPEGPMPKAM